MLETVNCTGAIYFCVTMLWQNNVEQSIVFCNKTYLKVHNNKWIKMLVVYSFHFEHKANTCRLHPYLRVCIMRPKNTPYCYFQY